jgi:vacuolar-type H+-ATPase subunit B/Vma2
VDFALVVVFLVASNISTSTGSEMTFLGLPLFFTTSEDILGVKLNYEGLSLGSDSQKREL